MTGRDVAQIARTIAVPPWSFTAALPAERDADDGFALDASGARFRLALTRVQFPEHDPQCSFLLRLPGGNSRCGLGALRPAACRVFPREGGVETCSCSWAGVPLEDDAARVELAALADERDRYAEVVRRWNAFVTSASETTFVHRDFCRFLLDAYATVA